MKAFTVNLEVYDGIIVRSNPFLHVAVGEQGRGRWCTRVPLGSKDFTPETTTIEQAGVIQTQKGVYIIVDSPENDRSDQALVLAQIPAGYRGTTQWTAATRIERPCPNNGHTYMGSSELDPIREHCRHCGTPLEPNEHPAYTWTHPYDKIVMGWAEFPPGNIKVIAEGYFADGEAGRMGGYDARLLIMARNAAFRVRRGGRLYGKQSELFIKWTGRELRLMDADMFFPPSKEDIDKAEVIRAGSE